MKKTILAIAASIIAISAHAFGVAAHGTSAHASVAHTSVSAHPVEVATVAHETTVSAAEKAPVKTSSVKAVVTRPVAPVVHVAAAKPASGASAVKAN